MSTDTNEDAVLNDVIENALLDFSEAGFVDQLKQSNNLRSHLINAILLKNKGDILTDPKMLSVLDKHIKGMDSTTLGQMRLSQEKDKSDIDQSIQRSYVMLMQQKGKDFKRGYEMGERPAGALEPELDGSGFTFIQGEDVVGDDVSKD